MSEPQLVENGPDQEQNSLVHRVQLPQNAGPHRTVVMLHGRAGNEDVMWVFAKTIPSDWLIIAPRAIEIDPDGGFSWRLRAQDEWPTLDQFDEAVTAVTQFIHALPNLYNADPAHIYLMGFSQGAAVSYAVAMRNPGLVQGIAGLVGFIPTRCDSALDASPLADLPIFMAVGKRDPLIPPERAAGCAQTLVMAGSNLEYHEYDTGHKLNHTGMQDLTSWWAERSL
ncbi:MAG: dienelactone hydrolase family protein [Ardenticatenaceae bacterium]|nr:dienelactone hydrolase family protein [Ardenticatenaceae bacterium]MCB9445033.1 dienelactone hydrolase family protein [Ardenticatenaceae bacterium]